MNISNKTGLVAVAFTVILSVLSILFGIISLATGSCTQYIAICLTVFPVLLWAFLGLFIYWDYRYQQNLEN